MGPMGKPAILIIVSVVCFLLSIGLCGVGMSSGNSGGSAIVAGLAGLGLSILLFFIGVVWLIVVAVQSRRRQL